MSKVIVPMPWDCACLQYIVANRPGIPWPGQSRDLTDFEDVSMDPGITQEFRFSVR